MLSALGWAPNTAGAGVQTEGMQRGHPQNDVELRELTPMGAPEIVVGKKDRGNRLGCLKSMVSFYRVGCVCVCTRQIIFEQTGNTRKATRESLQ